VVLEADPARDLRKDRVVLTQTRVQTWSKAPAALAHDDGSAADQVPSCALTPNRCEFESRPFLELP